MSRLLGCASYIFTHRHFTFWAASFLALQILLWDSPDPENDHRRDDSGTLNVNYETYAENILYSMVLEANQSRLKTCGRDRFRLHDASGLPMKGSNLFQKLGETQVHLIGAYLDDRLKTRYMRIFGVGLNPGRDGHLYCNYDCKWRPEARFCSIRATTVMIIAGNLSLYLSGKLDLR